MTRPGYIEHSPTAKVVQVIEVEYRRGQGVKDDPVRMVTGYYSFEGELLAERDDGRNTSWTEYSATTRDSA
jgi:hypothetical protein